jgi:hypothetical protein
MSEPDLSASAEFIEDLGPARPALAPAAVTAAAGDIASVRELGAIVLLVLLFNVVVFHGQGYAGYALGFVAAPLILWAGAPRRGLIGPGLVVGALMAILVVRMVWLGTVGQLLVGLCLIAAWAMILSGRMPYVLDTILCGWQLPFAGFMRIPAYAGLARGTSWRFPRDLGLRVLMPVVAAVLFGTLFIRANPDLAAAVDRGIEAFARALEDCFGAIFPTPGQVVLWGIVAWLSIGLLRPIRFGRPLDLLELGLTKSTAALPKESAVPLFPACRNTLLTVIALFTAYLVFEFQSLWFREFPQGFHYSGYAHEGAAWLTAALALATFTLSVIFRGRVLRDARLPRLKRLAFVWSALNGLLALAVFHRLWIYVGYNGMTRMRVVAFVGVATVLAGFLLVVWKIARNRGFVWLIERQLWTLALGLYLLAVLPMDVIVHRYNVARILAGDSAPAVQISEHDIDASGLAELSPLLDCDDPEVRAGIRALLAMELHERSLTTQDHWTAYQMAEARLLDQLAAQRPRLNDHRAYSEHADDWEAFRRYAYQWY